MLGHLTEVNAISAPFSRPWRSGADEVALAPHFGNVSMHGLVAARVKDSCSTAALRLNKPDTLLPDG